MQILQKQNRKANPLLTPLRRNQSITLALAVSLTLGVSPIQAKTAADKPDIQQMWQLLQQQSQLLAEQKKQIKALQSALNAQQEQTRQTRDAIEATGAALESVMQRDETGGHNSAGGQWYQNSTFGGYGELHYNGLQNNNGGADKNVIDFHRFVLFFGHHFSESLSFFSELEVEHVIASSEDDAKGEVALEQAYLDYQLNSQYTLKGGMILMPFGILNETHEPPTFYGTERNPVEKNIIPTTWSEGGVFVNAHYSNGLSTDLGMTSGLYITADNDFKIRGGRTRVSKAPMDSPAFSARVKYTGISGLELSVSGLYQGDYHQGKTDTSDSIAGFSTHMIYKWQKFRLIALYADWFLDGNAAKAIGADRQTGWYIEPSWRFSPQWGLFARYNNWDNAAGDNTDSAYSQVDFGVNYWPHENVVLKADYQIQNAPDGKTGYDGINLGIGYQF